MDDAFTIGQRLKQEALEASQNRQEDADWQALRSEAYARDNGVCWICKKTVQLQDYDLGHIVDRCEGGLDIIENVAPMHRWCNLSKPKHKTLEEAMLWLLKIKPREEKPASMFADVPPTFKPYPYPRNHNGKRVYKSQLSMIDLEANKALFQSSPALLNTSDTIKLEVLKLLNRMLDTTTTLEQKPNIPITVQPPAQVHPLGEHYKHYKRREPYRDRPASAKTVSRRQILYQEQIARIKPATVCWIQGRPLTGALWRVLPPPYRQEDLFTMRLTPPNAVDNGSGKPQKTIQVLGGVLIQEISVSLGRSNIQIIPNGTAQPSIVYFHSNQSNMGKREETVGTGIGQIPIDAWRRAKAQGISFADFKVQYRKSPQANPLQTFASKP